MDVDLQSIGIQTVQEALEKGSLIFNEKTKTDDFNRACDHILVLLVDAFQCFDRGSWGTSVFLSITAIEEVAKAEVGLYRREGKIEKAKRGKISFSTIKKNTAWLYCLQYLWVSA